MSTADWFVIAAIPILAVVLFFAIRRAGRQAESDAKERAARKWTRDGGE